jgi:hypothetical protein
MNTKVSSLAPVARIILAAFFCAFPTLAQNSAPAKQPPAPTRPVAAPANLNASLTPRQSEMLIVVRRYEADRDLLSRFYYLPSPIRFARLKRYDLDWAEALGKLDDGRLGAAAKADLQMLRGTVQDNLRKLESDAAAELLVAPMIPFAPAIHQLEEARLRMESMDAKRAALALSKITEQIAATRASLEAGLSAERKPGAVPVGKAAAGGGPAAVEALRKALLNWRGFYNGYDPLFTCWMAQPFKEVDTALQNYAAFLRDRIAPAAADTADAALSPAAIEPAPAPKYAEVPDLVRLLAAPQDEMRGVAQLLRPARGGRSGGGVGRPAAIQAAPAKSYWTGWLSALKKLNFAKLGRPAQISYLSLRTSFEGQIRRLDAPPAAKTPAKPDNSGINGRPLGRAGLLLDLADEMVPYTPEQIIEIGLREYAWCEAEMIKASREMGFGDDWKQAMEKVKDMHVPPGEQPDGIRDLLREAVEYIRAKDLLTIPEIDNETMRMEMMSPERQLVNPFFTGGSLISVSYPTDAMTTRQKLESMRGNSLPFSHATAFHEMIPGHNMQGYMGQRFDVYRSPVAGSSFWSEGWCVYWEMLMYDLGFHDTPEKRIGALFWRMHRCARIVFSLKFHLGEWSPQECIDYLIDKVNFERENAIGEVRRSFAGSYGPLYQAAYQLGALQLRRISRELVDSGKMTYKQFHDAVIEMGSLPFPLVRLALSDQKLASNMPLNWEFYGKIQ